MSWLPSSLRVQNGCIKRQRSSWVEKMALNKAAKVEVMMVVVDVEDWL
jgi:hypothetical protein